MFKILMVLTALIFTSVQLHALNLVQTAGVYHLKSPELSSGLTVQKMTMKFTEYKGEKKLIALACGRCAPSVYIYQEQESQLTGIPVFKNSAGLYVVEYQQGMLLHIQAATLGQQNWDKIEYLNIYAKDELQLSNTSLEQASTFAKNISDIVMKQENNIGQLGGI